LAGNGTAALASATAIAELRCGKRSTAYVEPVRHSRKQAFLCQDVIRMVRVPQMTSLRSPDLQLFLNSAEAAIRHGSNVDGRVGVAAERMFSALRELPIQAAWPEPARLPICCHLPRALEHARRQTGFVGALTAAFAVIEPQLNWKVRAGAETQPERFLNGHANAAITGPEGLEIRHDVRIGVSLMAPHTRYPDHRHLPEEIYVALSSGQWRQASNPWHEPGIGGLVYNPPNIVHAMRSTEQPLLALWFLWTEPNNAGS
jgi:quercetin dioxygenase-like cupin family protein